MTGGLHARIALTGVAVAAAALGLAACGGERAADRERVTGAVVAFRETAPVRLPPARPVPAARPSGARCEAGTVHEVGSASVSFAAVSRVPTSARRSPGGDVLATFGRVNANGHATVFGLRGVVRDGCGRLWYRAALPMRPNGVEGYVPARDVRVLRLTTRIVVDLSERRLTLLDGGEPVLRIAAAVGASDTPTPTGSFYVDQRLIPSDPDGPWGPGAIGISAFSDVLQEWSQGGPIAIHGTDQPGSIGRAASHGCLRVANDMLRRLFAATPAGTPVVIRE